MASKNILAKMVDQDQDHLDDAVDLRNLMFIAKRIGRIEEHAWDQRKAV